MNMHPENDHLDTIRDPKKLQVLYDQTLPSLRKHIQKNSGTLEDAEDIFQESVIVAYRKLKDPTFQLTSSLSTFVFSIAKRKWLYELKKTRSSVTYMESFSEPEGNVLDEMIINSERTNLYLKHFALLTDGCKEILTYFLDGIKMSEIAKKLGFSSEGYARKRKHQCQEKLLEAIKTDQVYNELKNE